MAFGVHLSAPNLADTSPQAMHGAGFVPNPTTNANQSLNLTTIPDPFAGDSISVNNLTQNYARISITPPGTMAIGGNQFVVIPPGGVWSQAFDNSNPISIVTVDYVNIPTVPGPIDFSLLPAINPLAGGFVNVIVVER